MPFIRSVALVVSFAGLAGFGRWEAIAAVLDISDVMQFFDHDKSSSISQSVKGKSRELQKLLKYFNETTTYLSNVLLSIGLLPIILVLYSKDSFATILQLSVP